MLISTISLQNDTGQCKRTGGCYNELVVAFFSTGGCVKGKKIYTDYVYEENDYYSLFFFYAEKALASLYICTGSPESSSWY